MQTHAREFEKLKQRLAALPQSQDRDDQCLVGAGDDEIRDLEDELGIRLPEGYRCFLRTMGHSAGPLFAGSEYSFSQRHRLRLRESAERIIGRSGADWQLPSDAFVFLMHHGYQFLFFRLSEGDDPPVYRFSDADETPVCIAPNLTAFFQSQIEQHHRIVRQYLAEEPAAESART